MNEHIQRQFCPSIMLARLWEDYPGISRHAGQSGKPGPFIEYLLKRIQVGSVA
jgi:hypothetical protein